MTPPPTADGDPRESGDLEFFGVQLKVKNPRLAALLNSSVNEDVHVVGARAREVFSGSDDGRAEREVERRVLHADDSVHIRLEGVEASERGARRSPRSLAAFAAARDDVS